MFTWQIAKPAIVFEHTILAVLRNHAPGVARTQSLWVAKTNNSSLWLLSRVIGKCPVGCGHLTGATGRVLTSALRNGSHWLLRV
jgi:hypothetical protein